MTVIGRQQQQHQYHIPSTNNNSDDTTLAHIQQQQQQQQRRTHTHAVDTTMRRGDVDATTTTTTVRDNYPLSEIVAFDRNGNPLTLVGLTQYLTSNYWLSLMHRNFVPHIGGADSALAGINPHHFNSHIRGSTSSVASTAATDGRGWSAMGILFILFVISVILLMSVFYFRWTKYNKQALVNVIPTSLSSVKDL